MQVRLLTIASVFSNNSEIPQIRIQGKWLEKLGFRQGKKFSVEERQGQLIIRLVSLENEN
ncbi:MAG TPA: SymE family type I addiction module toxin [Desulfitobacteriaceae bacterium]|nr:SymE family type I addiction module toxin [Desulfitobacteriaceae bacterium]